MRKLVAIFLVGMGILLSLPPWSGAQWEQAGRPKGGWITALAVSGPNIFAATRQGGVFISTDNGATWKAVNSGLPKRTDFQCLTVSGTNIFLGSFKGVFISTNNGASWTVINSGLPEGNSVYCLAASDTDLFAGTEEGKVWRLPSSDLSMLVNLSESVFSEQEWADIRKNEPKAVFIPKEIKAVMQEGQASRQGRQDIPFTIFKYLLFPAKDSLHSVFLFPATLVNLPAKDSRLTPAGDSLHAVLFFKAKNADLGYAVKAPAVAPEQQEAPPPPAGVHEANLNIFIEFRQTDKTGASKVVREVFVPVHIEEDSATYDPDKEEWYSVGYTLRPGKYAAAMAITPRTVPS